MPRHLFSALVLALATVLAAAAAPAAADTLVTIVSREQGPGDQPPREGIVRLWIGDDVVARDDGRTAAILRQTELVLVDHESRSFSRLALPADVAAMIPPEMRELAGQMMLMLQMHADVTPTDERRRVGRWDARRYAVELTNPMGMAVTMDLWLSEEVELPVARLEALAEALAEVQPGGAGWVAEINALPGFPVLQETRLAVGDDQITTREELVSIEEKPAPAAAYAPPEGYQETPFDPLPMDAAAEPAG